MTKDIEEQRRIVTKAKRLAELAEMLDQDDQTSASAEAAVLLNEAYEQERDLLVGMIIEGGVQ